MDRIIVMSVATFVLVATISCNTQREAGDSSAKDIGVVNASEAHAKVLYEERGSVYLKACKPPIAPPLTRSCPSDESPQSLELSAYIDELPYEVGSYQRDQQGLSFVTRALQDARDAVDAGNQDAVSTVERLEPIKANLEKILGIRHDLTAQQQDVTYYEYDDEFSKLLAPFGLVGGGGGGPFSGMRFVPVQGRRFAMQETEVTRGQWKAVMGRYPEDLPRWNECYHKEKTVFEDNHPVSCVSWDDANGFARRMNAKRDGYTYRLPSADEWLHAAGDIEGPTYGHCDASSTQRVGALRAHNGLYDMVGNVFEWTSTVTPRTSSNTYFGASWSRSAEQCFIGWLNTSVRAGDLHSDLGFRLLRTRP